MDGQQEQLLQQNAELKKQLADKTSELRQKNTELEIEAALERVRAAALGMKAPADMLEVCTVIAEELNRLGVKEIRNVQTAIFHESKGTYMNYEYYARHDKTVITETSYTNHPMHRAFASQMLKGGGEFFSTHLSKAELPDWIAYQKSTNVFIDNFIQTAPSLDYYWFSLGVVALGTSTYSPLNEEEIRLFKRFRNVFELSYRRYLDIEKAEAQAREAEIELALERVRAKTMAMHKSNDLLDLINTLSEQFQDLGFKVDVANFNTNYREKDWDLWLWVSQTDKPERVYIPYFDHPYFNTIRESLDKGLDFNTTVFTKEEKNSFQEYLYNTVLKDVPQDSRELIYEAKGFAWSVAFFNNVSITIGNYDAEPYTEEQNSILKRFGNVFEQAYTRFLDLEKAEAQAREAQIEAALEKVRSRSLAVHHSEEFKDVVKVVFERLELLGLEASAISINTFTENSGGAEIYICSRGEAGLHIFQYHLPYFESLISNDLLKARKNPAEFFTKTYNKEEKDIFYKNALQVPGLKNMPGDIKTIVHNSAAYTISLASTKHSMIVVNDFAGNVLSQSNADIIRRFAKVFEQAYVRFLDLQKAEAQARENQIQLGLERARAQSMMMQHSTELDDTLRVFHEQVLQLNIPSAFSFLWLPDEDKNRHIFWAAWAENNSFKSKAINYPLDRNEPATAQCLIDWKSDAPVVSYHVPPDGVANYFAAWSELIAGVEELKPECFSDGLYYVEAFMKYGCFGVMVKHPLPEDEKKVLERFAIEFERTYTRFLDLQKAEAQTRESQIQLALERVRASTMAMHKSDGLIEIMAVMFEQLAQLQFRTDAITLSLEYKTNILNLWMAVPGEAYPAELKIPYTNISVINRVIEAVKSGSDFYSATYDFEEKNQWINHLLKNTIVGKSPDDRKQFLLQSPGIALSIAMGKNIALLVANYAIIPFSDEENSIIERFANVFEQSYIRFLDLQKAEAQAREAKIETALEKVRSRSLAMHTSDELGKVVTVVIEKLSELDLKMDGAIIAIYAQGSRDQLHWTVAPDLDISAMCLRMPYFDNIIMTEYFNAKEEGLDFFQKNYSFEEKNSFFNYIYAYTDYKQTPDNVKEFCLKSESYAYSVAFAKNSGIMLLSFSGQLLSETDTEILKRFATVFDQAYTRFLDLQRSEMQTLETIRRASVDRVRAEIASMRTTKDLERITPLIWNELTTLGVPFIRCGVFIMNDDTRQIETHLSTPDGEAIATFSLPYDAPGETSEILTHWRNKELYKQHWDEVQFAEFTQNLAQQGTITHSEKYVAENRPTDLYLHFLPFQQGMLYAGNTLPLNDDELQLMQNLADAFSTAYARYEDFNKLEAAKKEVDIALNKLQATQKQLIQSEKMASLGELTAGIAHEIQNPLNFVNNFSEVSNDMINELQLERLKAEMERDKVLEDGIINDIKQNLEKINHHGKRADAIVKGMLQHSRKNEGVKEPTDINALCDEFLRLSYHGLRAKDKSFNADFKTDFDESIGRINIIPQDIGRVLLNLFNNAFYAVKAPGVLKGEEYKPLVSVTTRKIDPVQGTGARVEIIVRDNGSGIPQNIIDKIFQPFFTTKPSGQGTGLGLSLSYDIIKAHGGEIKVDTKEGEGSAFMIQLPVL
jgi:signal transduction histidine kinase